MWPEVKYGVHSASLWSANASLVSKREMWNTELNQWKRKEWLDQRKDEWKKKKKKKKKTNEKREWTNALFLVSYVFEVHHKKSQI